MSAGDERLAIGLAFAAALLLACGATVQHRVAHRTGTGDRGFDPGMLLRLARQPIWLLGFGMTLAHFSLQATALANGRLVVVEPILSTGLLLALPLSAAFGRGRMRRLDWLAAASAAAGLVGFLVLAAPTTGRASVRVVPLVIVVGCVIVLAAAIVTFALRRAPSFRALAFGAAAGILAAGTDACTKTVAHLVAAKHFGVLIDPRLALLAVVGLSTYTLQQNGYGSGGLAGSLPALAVLQPTAGVILGVVIYSEAITTGPLHVLGEAGFAVLAAVGIVTLARSPLARMVDHLEAGPSVRLDPQPGG